jgi:VanZ family protein
MCVLALAFYSLSPPALKEAAGGEPGTPGQINHAFAYGVTAVALRWAYPQVAPLRTLLLLVIYGCALESLQNFVPGRSPKVIDALSSGLGAGIGTMVGLGLRALLTRLMRRDRDLSSAEGR